MAFRLTISSFQKRTPFPPLISPSYERAIPVRWTPWTHTVTSSSCLNHLCVFFELSNPILVCYVQHRYYTTGDVNDLHFYLCDPPPCLTLLPQYHVTFHSDLTSSQPNTRRTSWICIFLLNVSFSLFTYLFFSVSHPPFFYSYLLYSFVYFILTCVPYTIYDAVLSSLTSSLVSSWYTHTYIFLWSFFLKVFPVNWLCLVYAKTASR